MILGLKRGTVRLVPHQVGWASAFTKERDLLLSLLGPTVLRIEHVGSTAIPGIVAKPIVDIAVAVQSLDGIESWSESLKPYGYTSFGDREARGEHFFAKGPDDMRTHYMHVVPLDSNLWNEYLRFRDMLRSDFSLRQQYEDLKKRSACAHSESRPSYTIEKGSWIKNVLA